MENKTAAGTESALSNLDTSSSAPIPFRSYIPNLMILVIMIAASLFFAQRLPDQIPTKFDFAGNPTQYSGKLAILVMMPLTYSLLILGIPLLMKVSPRGYKLEQSKRLIPQANTAGGLLLASIHVGLLLSGMDPEKYQPSQWLTFGMGLFMTYLGNVMGKSERNFFIGVRTPWTLASEKNWQATHRFAGRIMVLTGVLLLIYFWLARTSLVVSVASILFAMLIPVFYSLWYYQTFEKTAEIE